MMNVVNGYVGKVIAGSRQAVSGVGGPEGDAINGIMYGLTGHFLQDLYPDCGVTSDETSCVRNLGMATAKTCGPQESLCLVRG
jgi:hypothetical protein